MLNCGTKLDKELLEEYVEWKFPEEIYGKPSLETYLMIYDSYAYKLFVWHKAVDNLKEDLKNIFKRRK